MDRLTRDAWASRLGLWLLAVSQMLPFGWALPWERARVPARRRRIPYFH